MDGAIINSSIHPGVEELAAISAFAGLPAEGLEWLASEMETFELRPGEILVHAGDPANRAINASRTGGGISTPPSSARRPPLR